MVFIPLKEHDRIVLRNGVHLALVHEATKLVLDWDVLPLSEDDKALERRCGRLGLLFEDACNVPRDALAVCEEGHRFLCGYDLKVLMRVNI